VRVVVVVTALRIFFIFRNYLKTRSAVKYCRQPPSEIVTGFGANIPFSWGGSGVVVLVQFGE
jgi:hypothetical protein